MAGAKSLVVLSFLLVIATSHAANCRYSICYHACRKLFLSRETCSKRCHCSLSTFVPNELGRKVKLPEALASKMEEDYNRAEAVLEDEEMTMIMEELINFNDKLTDKCMYQICYHACRKHFFSREFCVKKCNCSLGTFVPNELGRKVKLPEALDQLKMDEGYNHAEAVLEDEEMTMMMEEMINLNDKLTGHCKYQPCYRACRAVGFSKTFCAKKCNCTLPTEVLAGSKYMKDADDEESATN